MSSIRGLYESPLFKGLDPDKVDRAVSGLPTRSFRPDDYLIRQGDYHPEILLITSGSYRVLYREGDNIRITYLFHQAPGMVGQIEIFTERPYLGNVIAITDCEAVVLPREDYLSLLNREPVCAVNMVMFLSNLLCTVGDERRIDLFGQAKHIVARTLVSLAKLLGEEKENRVGIPRAVSKTELAELFGLSRRSVIRACEELEAAELVAFQKGEVSLPFLKRIREMMRDF